ncbi:conserved hypothetical protein [Treponema primitia ZAS-2]|uniref:Uncharacterized protein n=2 Tax=Treponema primitia TaxID=88058 RepID=F5YLY7_TREPZ|nr:conserved hypothetical protein [Treponema primitia ZAS-2]
MIKRYYIKCGLNQTAYFDILEQTAEGYRVRITRTSNGYEKTADEFLDNRLFDTCLKTGYIFEMKESASSVA